VDKYIKLWISLVGIVDKYIYIVDKSCMPGYAATVDMWITYTVLAVML